LETSVNTGALFGFGQGYVGVFAVVSILAMIAILAWLIWGPGIHELWFAVTMGFILAGIVGNLYDRLGLWGSPGVRDWILLKYGSFVWPNFNLADSFLVCGALFMALSAFRAPTADTTAPPATKAAER
jgi:signal peptidase II